MKVNLPTGDVAYLPGGTRAQAAEHERFLKARYDFAKAYAQSKSWSSDLDQLTIVQILEIRDQPGWKTPEGLSPLRVTGTFVPKDAK